MQEASNTEILKAVQALAVSVQEVATGIKSLQDEVHAVSSEVQAVSAATQENSAQLQKILSILLEPAPIAGASIELSSGPK
jgi:methyl-accepting chemotaxis protein